MRELRQYNVKDLHTVISMLVKMRDSKLKTLLTDGNGTVAADVSQEEQEERVGALVMDVLGELWENCEQDIMVWFASLCNMEAEAFMQEPPDIVLDVIEAIAERKESKDFFSKASRLFNKLGGFGKPTKKR